MSDQEKARQRLERLRTGYQRWRRATNGESYPEELPDGELTPEVYRRIAEAVSLPEPVPGPPVAPRKKDPRR